MRTYPINYSNRRKEALTSLTPHASRLTGGQNLVTSPATGAGRFRIPHSAFRVSSAFSLIEILVVIGLLSIIILGLLMMFTQTQRAFRAGMAQVDVLEAGRAATEMISREVSQITPLHRSNAVNFYVGLPNYTPLLQPLPGAGAVKRTNLLEEMFFLTRENRDWSGIGYVVGPPVQGVATLYRFNRKNIIGQDPAFLYNSYLNTPLSNMNRIIDGVVHFKVRAYDTTGNWLTRDLTNNFNFSKSDIRWSTTVAAGEIGLYKFFSNAVPAFVEFELGVLEDRALARVRSIPDATARRQYLENQAGRVHLFRMRVPIRNVDPLAYQ